MARTKRSKRNSTTRSERERPFAFGLGGNLGDARGAIVEAVARLARRFGPLELAPLYRTEAVSPVPQPAYLNTVALGHGAFAPEILLAGALAVETELGRQRAGDGEPRTIDVDLLLVGELARTSTGLTLPHPRLRERPKGRYGADDVLVLVFEFVDVHGRLRGITGVALPVGFRRLRGAATGTAVAVPRGDAGATRSARVVPSSSLR